MIDWLIDWLNGWMNDRQFINKSLPEFDEQDDWLFEHFGNSHRWMQGEDMSGQTVIEKGLSHPTYQLLQEGQVLLLNCWDWCNIEEL